MTMSTMRAGALGCALLASTALTGPAFAQSAPSIYQHPDENGVDMVDGSFNFALLEGSIGSGEGTLELIRYYGFGGQRDNVTLEFRRSVSGGNATINLYLGNRRETFTGASSATSFTSGQANGAVLTKLSASHYRYTSADGTITNYVAPPGLTDASNNGYCSTVNEFSCRLVPTSTVRPDGHSLTFGWDVGENCTQTGNGPGGEPIFSCAQFWRLRSVSNNFGYRISFAFVQEANPTSGLPPVNWHTRSGATLSNTSIAGSPTRTVSYAYPSSTVTDVTTDAGVLWKFTRDSQQRVTGIRRPGSSSDDVAVTYAGATSLAVASTTIDGVATTYGNPSSGTRTRTFGHAHAYKCVEPGDDGCLEPVDRPPDLGHRPARPHHQLPV